MFDPGQRSGGALRARGELRIDSETKAAWVRPEDLDGYDIHPAILRRISHALYGTGPHVD